MSTKGSKTTGAPIRSIRMTDERWRRLGRLAKIAGVGPCMMVGKLVDAAMPPKKTVDRRMTP